MSRVVRFCCDRCGKDLPGVNNRQISDNSARLDVYAIGSNRTGATQRIDLCEDCFERFVDFLEIGD